MDHISLSQEGVWQTVIQVLAIILLSILCLSQSHAMESTNNLCLVPFPKQAELQSDRFQLNSASKIIIGDISVARCVADELRKEWSQAAGVSVNIQTEPNDGQKLFLRTSKHGLKAEDLPTQPEGYRLVVAKDGITLEARDEAGLLWGIQTLRQLVRSNSSGGSIPCVTITDYPSLKWRGFQDDLTRGQSSKLDQLKSEIDLGSLLKMNFWTYYMENQFAFSKLPEIGPKDGCFLPSELKELVKYAKISGVEVIGCQQSFGHFYHFLGREEYKDLQETTWVISPAKEGSYTLLSDLYYDQATLTDSEFFNVCCDETVGLGEGPSKPLVEKIGVGGVYAQHLKRLHGILRDKYNKRMMMWGDIILQHPENLSDIPKDTLVLSWGYHAAPSFDYAVIPFEKAGYEYFVAPGVNCWNRILPDFETSVVNIKNYVRDGVNHSASGMLNTTWDDDGENLYSVNWHGIAWGTECAWNGSTTDIKDFNRRLGAVLFGEKSGNFGKAIELLGKLHSLPGYDAMFNSRFWKVNFGPALSKDKNSQAVLAIVEPALKHLKAAKREAKFNTEILDHHIFVAERVQLMATREIDYVKAAQAYNNAEKVGVDKNKALANVRKSLALLVGIRDRHVDLRDRYTKLWLAENKPYALDWSIAKYNKLIGDYDNLIQKIENAAKSLESGNGLPGGNEVGLTVAEANPS